MLQSFRIWAQTPPVSWTRSTSWICEIPLISPLAHNDSLQLLSTLNILPHVLKLTPIATYSLDCDLSPSGDVAGVLCLISCEHTLRCLLSRLRSLRESFSHGMGGDGVPISASALLFQEGLINSHWESCLKLLDKVMLFFNPIFVTL